MKRRKFRTLEMVAKKFINSYSSGVHPTTLHDSLIDVDTARQYQPGDKRLDVRSSLRCNQTMARVFNPERGMTLSLLLDVSASAQAKAEAATLTALYLAHLADMGNDQAGLITFADRVYDAVEPNYDSRHLAEVLERWYDRAAYPPGTELAHALRRAAEMCHENSMAVILSDFCCEVSDSTIAHIKYIASGKGNSVLAVVFHDPNDWFFEARPFTVDFVDAETTTKVGWDMAGAAGQAGAFDGWRDRLRLTLRRCGAEPIFINISQENYLLPLVRYLLRS